MITKTSFPYGFYGKSSMRDHENIKKMLLSHFDNYSGGYDTTSEYLSDSVHKVDWKHSTNFDRPWVKDITPNLSEFFEDVREGLGYDGWNVEQIWFQQYLTSNTHGWHTHGSNFTGVYYVELDDSSPKTQLVYPYTTKVITADVKEGDIIFFPSYVVHRAPPVENDIRKTIVSFNFVVTDPNKKLIDALRGKL